MGMDWETRGVLADFRECQRASWNTDLVFHCANGHVSAHQMIFAGISPFFTDLMQRFVIGQDLLPLDLNISLPEIRREHVEMVVEMVYTGQVRITKGDYRPFREICKLLDLCVPIADYDKFFMNQCDNDQDDVDEEEEEDEDDGSDDDIQFVEHSASESQMPEISIPLQSCSSSSRAFVCGDCHAIFSLKTDLTKHKESEHGQTESLSSDSPTSPILSEPSTVTQLYTRLSNSQHNQTELQVSDSPSSSSSSSSSSIVSEPSKVSPLKTRLRSQRSSNRSGNLINPPNDERRVECPDCLHLFAPKRVRLHLISHLRHQLNERVTKSKSVSGFLKCKLCWYETPVQKYMIRHLGLAHDMVTKLASEAQIKFLDEGKQLIAEARHSSSKHQSMPRNENTFNKPRTRKRILKNEDISEIEDSDVETEIGITLGDESQALNAPPVVLSPPMCTRLTKRATYPIENENIKEISRVVKCPDCLKLVNVLRAREHLISHVRTHINKHLIKTKSVPKLFKCQLCPFESVVSTNMRHHLGVVHEMMMKYSNADQKKFIADADSLLVCKRRKAVTYATKTNYQQQNERLIECPDCRKSYHSLQVRTHLVSHLRKHLDKFVMKSQTMPEGFRCKLCSHESYDFNGGVRHVGIAHNLIETFANEEQKKFLYGKQKIFPNVSSKHRKSSSKVKKMLKTTKTRNSNVEYEDLSEMQDNNIEVEMDIVPDGADETESPRPEGLAESQCFESL